ncbi:MAG: methylamine utilization protein [Sphingomonas bacterium]|nr:methylamine utilization protein [Sphingomonas bacterium]
MRIVALLPFVALLGAVPPPSVASVAVTMRAPNGKPIANAVVIIHLVGRATPAARVGGSYAVRQQDIQFNPFLTVVPVNADVAFPNLDAVRHQVYSFSPAKRFELKLYAREQNRTIRFDRPGPVSLGCNIHDQMTAFVYITDSAYTARTDAAGRVVFDGVPSGPATITVWHPYLRSPGNQLSRQIAVGNGATEGFVGTLRPPPAANTSY